MNNHHHLWCFSLLLASRLRFSPPSLHRLHGAKSLCLVGGADDVVITLGKAPKCRRSQHGYAFAVNSHRLCFNTTTSRQLNSTITSPTSTNRTSSMAVSTTHHPSPAFALHFLSRIYVAPLIPFIFKLLM